MSSYDRHALHSHKRGLNGSDDVLPRSQPHKRVKNGDTAPSSNVDSIAGSDQSAARSSTDYSATDYVDLADARQASSQSPTLASNHEEEEYELDLDPEAKTIKLLEESRRRRQTILEKYATKSSSATTKPLTSDRVDESSPNEVRESDKKLSEPFHLAKSATDIPVKDATALGEAISYQQVSAAEYDADADRAEELSREQHRRQTRPATVANTSSGGKALKEEVYEEIEVTDSEDDLDMFALDAEVSKPKKKIRVLKQATASVESKIATVFNKSSNHVQSNWDDADGYLRIILGEVLVERYQITANLGRGMFASVVKARDTQKQQKEVAIKIIRVQETMYKAGLKEISILEKLIASDPEDKKHVVRLESHFEYKGHLCMVFESLSMNLRDVVRRFGKDVGLNVQAVRTYAYQLFLSLSHLEKNQIMHADIKPDNILVNDTKTILKLCDLGSASDLSEMEITPYLVSRFYRAPEIILGQAYDCSIDVWSTGCTLYELATGKILFPGRTNNHMLLLMQELRGRFTGKQLRKSQFSEQHFDGAQAFLSLEPDQSTGHNTVRRVTIQKPSFDLRARLLPGDTAKQLKTDDVKVTNHLIDFLARCLELDPLKRLTPKQALAHPFLAI